MFEKILVPLDGSALSERVLGSLEPLLVRPTTGLVLVRVVPGGPIARDEAAQAPAKEYIFGLETQLAKRGFRATGHVLVGDDPAAEVVSFAAKSGASLICCSTHGRTGMKRLLLGSVAEQMLRTSHRPLLLVNPWVPGAPLQFKRIVVPLDGSERGGKSLPIASEIAKHFGAELVLVHVEVLTALDPTIAVRAEHAETVAMFERAKKALGAARVRTVARAGFPSDEILDTIRTESPDLVLMTTHGRTGLERIAFGSVAEEVIRRSPCPVLVVRSVRSSVAPRTLGTAP
jgi:nucleotide-binding universal stress UspA family protein